jgi:hypothetical protein
MKTFIKSPLNLFVAGLIVASSFTFVQCEKPDTLGQISFTNLVDGKPVSGAKVTLFIDTTKSNAGFFLCNSSNKITPQKTYTTNSSGQINQCFDLPALVNVYAHFVVDATPDTANWDSLAQITILEAAVIEGEGKLNLIANETTSITIKMN